MEANYGFFNSSLTSPTCAFPHVYYYLFSVGFYVLGRLTGPRIGPHFKIVLPERLSASLELELLLQRGFLRRSVLSVLIVKSF